MYHDLVTYWFSHPSVWFRASSKDDEEIARMFRHMFVYTEDPACVLGAILLYDQVSRHIRRVDPTFDVSSHHAIALELAENILSDPKWAREYSYDQRCFVLMPLRHTFEVTQVKRVWKTIKDWPTTNASFLRRFKRATLISLGKLENQSLVHRTNETDVNRIRFRGKSILEQKDALDRTKTHPLCHEIRLPEEEFVLSLSGGVDSMVLFHLCLGKKFKVLHVNYGRRPESDAEETFVVSWCSRFDVPCYVRNFHGVPVKDREVYEEVTKQVRFHAYETLGDTVVMGHHQGDVFENIVTNVSSQKNADNLSGMEQSSEILGVRVMRPLLSVPKEEIVQFAKTIGIPYLADSTRPKCQRGRIRNGKYPENFPRGLLLLSNKTKRQSELIQRAIIEPFFEKQVHGACMSLENTECFDDDVWRTVLNRIMVRMNLPPVSLKSSQHFANRIKRLRNVKKQTIVLNREARAVYEANQNVIRFYTRREI